MKRNKRNARVRIAKLLLSAILLACSATTTNAQDFVKTYYAHQNVKQYSVIPMTDKDHYLAVGTFQNKYVNFIRTDATGNILVNRIYREIGTGSEEHAVSIVAVDPDTYMIVCLRRDASIGSGSFDKIKVYTVDANGNILDAQNIGATTVGGTNYSNFYPMHALYNAGTLFICGFVSNQNINDPVTPNFRGSQTKRAFVTRYDPSTLTATTETYDNTYTPANEQTDFDVAMRMKMTSNGQLYVTGSANVIQAASSSSSTYALNAGTLNLELNASTLAVVNTGYTTFTAEPFGAGYNYGEYGVDIVEDPATNGYFIVGNNADYAKLTTVIDPHNLQFSYINSSFQPQGIKSRMRLHGLELGAWGLTAMESENGAGHFVVGGMQTDYLPSCNYNAPPPSKDNFNPYLADVSLQWNTGSSTISGSLNDWKTYLTHFSTGHSTLANSYYQYGLYVADNAWEPVFAARRSIGDPLGDDIIMTAPTWNQSSQLLSLKLMRTDPYGDIPECPESYITCIPDLEPTNVVNITSITSTISVSASSANLPVTVAAAPSVPSDMGYDVIDCEANGGNYYRTVPNSVVAVNAAENIEATLLPNPASDFVQVSIEGNTDVDAAVKVELTDITGKLLKTLYNGKAAGINDQSHFTLPSVATGMYLVKISVGNQVMPVQKLIINTTR